MIVVLIYWGTGLSRPVTAWLLAGITLGLAALDVLRHRIPALQSVFRRAFGAILDPKDERGVNGSTLYFAGCATAVALFAKPAACAGILALACGDSAAAIVGSSVKSPRWGRVSVAGTSACFVAAAACARIFFPWPSALLAGLAAAALEAFSGSKYDNVTIPVGTAFVLAMVA